MYVKLCKFYNFLDIDECGNTDLYDCTDLCNNIAGTYTCACSDGYSLDDDDHTCSGKLSFISNGRILMDTTYLLAYQRG